MLDDGRRFRAFTVLDMFTRECLAIVPGISLTGTQVVSCLKGSIRDCGVPQRIQVDNGSEFYSRAMDSWACRSRVHIHFIRPGRPGENANIESCNGKLRDEFLNIHLFYSFDDACKKMEAWRRSYNETRPHSGLGWKTPTEFAQAKITESGASPPISLL